MAQAKTKSTTGELVLRCQQRQQQGQSELYEKYRDDVARTVFLVLGPDPDLEDVIQEVFIEAFRSIARFRGQSKVTTWLYRVTVNVALQRLRRRRRHPEGYRTPLQEEGHGETPQRSLERKEARHQVYAILDTLSEKKRVVFVLHEIMGLSSPEIAELLHTNVLTVRTRLHYARKQFYEKSLETALFTGDH